MQEIKVFLGSSITEFSDLRNELTSFLEKISRILISHYEIELSVFRCDDGFINPFISLNGTQIDFINQHVEAADICLFIFGEKIGVFSKEEFDIATTVAQKHNFNQPKVSVYFKKSGQMANEVEQLKEEIYEKYKHYYNEFDHTDTIKLSFLAGLNAVSDKIHIELKNGICYIDDEEILSVDNLPQFSLNRDLLSLKEELEDLDVDYYRIKPAYLAGDESLFKDYVDITARKNYLTNAISELEENIFKLTLNMQKDIVRGEISLRQKKAYEYLNEGKYQEALVVLDIDDINNDYYIRKEARKKLEALDVENFIKEHRLAVEVLLTSLNENRFIEIKKRYDCIAKEIIDTRCSIEYIFDCLLYYIEHEHKDSSYTLFESVKKKLIIPFEDEIDSELLYYFYIYESKLYVLTQESELSCDSIEKAMNYLKYQEVTDDSNFEEDCRLFETISTLCLSLQQAGSDRLKPTLEQAEQIYESVKYGDYNDIGTGIMILFTVYTNLYDMEKSQYFARRIIGFKDDILEEGQAENIQNLVIAMLRESTTMDNEDAIIEYLEDAYNLVKDFYLQDPEPCLSTMSLVIKELNNHYLISNRKNKMIDLLFDGYHLAQESMKLNTLNGPSSIIVLGSEIIQGCYFDIEEEKAISILEDMNKALMFFKDGNNKSTYTYVVHTTYCYYLVYKNNYRALVEVCDTYSQFIDIHPFETLIINYYKGLGYYNLQEYSNAYIYLEEAVKLRDKFMEQGIPNQLPPNEYIEYKLNYCAYTLKKFEKAIQYGKYAIEKYPLDLNDKTNTYIRIVMSYYNLNRKKELLDTAPYLLECFNEIKKNNDYSRLKDEATLFNILSKSTDDLKFAIQCKTTALKICFVAQKIKPFTMNQLTARILSELLPLLEDDNEAFYNIMFNYLIYLAYNKEQYKDTIINNINALKQKYANDEAKLHQLLEFEKTL